MAGLATEKEFRQSRTSQACESEANLICLVHLVAFVCLIDSGNLVSFVQPQNQTSPGKPDNSLLQLESVFAWGGTLRNGAGRMASLQDVSYIARFSTFSV